MEIRVFSEPGRSFHPKAYLFDFKDDSEIFVGSANFSWTALTTGVEWTYRLRRSEAPRDYDKFSQEFERLYHLSLPVTKEFMREYWQEWKQAGK